jgi:LysM repeat protein
MAKSCREVLGITLAVVCSMLTACTEFWSGPAPVFVNLGAGSAGSRPVVKRTTPDIRFVTVRPGQSLGGIAEANHVSTPAVIAANRLSPPYKLKIGQRLAIPAAMAEASVKGEKTAAPVPVRSRQSTAMAHTRPPRPPGRAKHTASAEMIPLDDPALPRTDNTASMPVLSGTPGRPAWVSPPSTAASAPPMTLSPDTAKDSAKPSVN